MVFALLCLPFLSYAQKPTYEDSVRLFTNTRELRAKLIRAHYVVKEVVSGYEDDPYLLREQDIIDAANHNNVPPENMKYRGRYRVGAARVGNLYRVYDFYFGQINKSLGYQYFSTVIRPYKKEKWSNDSTGDARLVYNYRNVKPYNFEKSKTKTNTVEAACADNKTDKSHKLVILWYHNDRLDSTKNYTVKDK